MRDPNEMVTLEIYTVDKDGKLSLGDNIWFDVTRHKAELEVMGWAENHIGNELYSISRTPGDYAGKIKYGTRLIGMFFMWKD